jgi:hypothetical protein
MNNEFVAVYRYQLKKGNLRQLKEITRQANPLYKKYGWSGKSETLIRQNGETLNVLYLEYFESEERYKQIMEGIDGDRELLKLRKSFDEVILPDTFTEEFYVLEK